MLTTLRIENIALIDALEVEFSQGLNVLTGETGAGKSVIIGSIGIALGGRFDRALLRNEEKDGLIEVSFSLTGEEQERFYKTGILPEDILMGDMGEQDIDFDKDSDENPDKNSDKISDNKVSFPGCELTITRKLTKNRVVNRINGETVPLNMLKNTAEQLINLHAQHEQTTLLSPAKHLMLLDSSDEKVQAERDKVRELYRKRENLLAEQKRIDRDPAERAKRVDFLRFQIEEIMSARLIPGEDTDLEESYRRMSHAEEILDICQEVYQLTSDEGAGGAASAVARGVRSLQALNRLDGESSLPGQLSEVENLLSDFNQSLAQYMEESAFSPEELRETEERLNLINGLKAKYGRTIEEVLSTAEELTKELSGLEKAEETIASLENELKKVSEELTAEAEKLTALRKKAAKPLEKQVLATLKDMNFSHVEFYTAFEELPEITSDGRDGVCFMLSTNLGEPAKPLHKVASGGELSRVMLALKATLSDAADTPTLVFDEIDVGISGVTAQKIGVLLGRLAESRQILVITHLPQIAAAGESAYRIDKREDAGKTYTGITKLSEEGRVEEIARLLGGDRITDTIRQSARELLCGAGKKN